MGFVNRMSLAGRSLYLIVYDILEDKRRLRVYKNLNAVGERVQRSAFECYLTQKELQTLMRKLEKCIDKDQDNLRIYPVCEACRPKMVRLGQGKTVDPPGLMIL